MTAPSTRAAAWLLNRCPPWCCHLAPRAVVAEALQQLHTTERRAVALARAELVMAEARELLAELEAER